jgi:hypothetical protein
MPLTRGNDIMNNIKTQFVGIYTSVVDMNLANIVYVPDVNNYLFENQFLIKKCILHSLGQNF